MSDTEHDLEPAPPPPIHFRHGTGTACGAKPPTGGLTSSTWPAHVTCEDCRRTIAWKAAHLVLERGGTQRSVLVEHRKRRERE